MEKNNFIVKYISNRGMQNISKSEYEQLIFYWMVKKQQIFGNKDFGALTASDLYEISDGLGLDISKVKTLVKKMQFMRDEDSGSKNPSFAQIIFTHLSSATFFKTDNSLEFFIVNPIQQEIVKRQISEKGGKYDGSFSNNILKIPLCNFERLLTKAELDDLVEKLTVAIEKQMTAIPEKFKGNEEYKIAEKEFDELKKTKSGGKSLEKINTILVLLTSLANAVASVATIAKIGLAH